MWPSIWAAISVKHMLVKVIALGPRRSRFNVLQERRRERCTKATVADHFDRRRQNFLGLFSVTAGAGLQRGVELKRAGSGASCSGNLGVLDFNCAVVLAVVSFFYPIPFVSEHRFCLRSPPTSCWQSAPIGSHVGSTGPSTRTKRRR